MAALTAFRMSAVVASPGSVAAMVSALTTPSPHCFQYDKYHHGIISEEK